MTAGGEGSAVTRPALAPAFAPEGLVADGVTAEAAQRWLPDALRLSQKVQAYDPKANTGLIDAAYALASQAHATQMRDNGDPVHHPCRWRWPTFWPAIGWTPRPSPPACCTT